MVIWVNNVGYLQTFIEFQCQDYVILHVTDEQIDMHYSDRNSLNKCFIFCLVLLYSHCI